VSDDDVDLARLRDARKTWPSNSISSNEGRVRRSKRIESLELPTLAQAKWEGEKDDPACNDNGSRRRSHTKQLEIRKEIDLVEHEDSSLEDETEVDDGQEKSLSQLLFPFLVHSLLPPESSSEALISFFYFSAALSRPRQDQQLLVFQLIAHANAGPRREGLGVRTCLIHHLAGGIKGRQRYSRVQEVRANNPRPQLLRFFPCREPLVAAPALTKVAKAETPSRTESIAPADNGPPKLQSSATPTSPKITHITVKVNHDKASLANALGPFLDRRKVERLPGSFGPGPINRVVRESVQQLVDAANDQKEVFGMLRQGEGKVIITASFEDKMQTIRLPPMNKPADVWGFMEILFEELRCEPFYEAGPVVQVDRTATLPRSHSQSSLGGRLPSMEDSHPPTLTPATQKGFPSTTDSLFKRKLEATKADQPIAKHPRLSADKEKEKGEEGTQPQPQATRPRGRPLGSKNKVAEGKQKGRPSTDSSSSKVPSASSSPVRQQATSPHKKVPIYHNAHKLYGHQPIQPQLSLATPAYTAPSTTQLQQQQQHLMTGGGVMYTPPPVLAPNTLIMTPAAAVTAAAQPVVAAAPQPLVSAEHLAHAQQQQQVQAALAASPFHISRLPSDPNEWSMEQVIGHLSLLDPSLVPHVEMFRSHEIDGKALLLLTAEMMMKYMDMKLGPALKIVNVANMITGKRPHILPAILD